MSTPTTLTVTINDGSGNKKVSLPGKWFFTPGRYTFLLKTPLNLGPSGYVLRNREDFRTKFIIDELVKYDFLKDSKNVYVFEFYSNNIVNELGEKEKR